MPYLMPEVTYEIEVLFKRFVKKIAMEVHGMTEEEAEDAGGELRLSGEYKSISYVLAIS